MILLCVRKHRSDHPFRYRAYNSPCEKFWLGDTQISDVQIKRFPGETSWVARKGMLTAVDLTLRDASDPEKVLNCVRRMDVFADKGG